MLVYQRVSSLRRAVMMNKNLNKLATRSLKVVARLSDQVFLFSKTAHSGSMTYSASQTRCNLVLRVRSPSAYVGNPRKTLPFWDGFAGSICSDFWDGLLNIWFATIHRCYVFFRFPQTVCPSQCWCRLGPRVDWLTVEPETTKKPSGKAGRVKEKLLEGAKFVGNTAAKSEPLDQIRSWVRCGTANGWPKMMRQVHKGISEEIGQEQYALFWNLASGIGHTHVCKSTSLCAVGPLDGWWSLPLSFWSFSDSATLVFSEISIIFLKKLHYFPRHLIHC